MSNSTASAAKAAIFAGVKAALVSDDALVTYGPPGPNQPDDIVMIGRVEREVAIAQIIGSGGQGWLDEEYTVEVVISCYRGGDDFQTVVERSLALADTVVTFVRSDPSLGGVVLVASPRHWLTEEDWETDHKGVVATTTGEIHCQARI